MIDQSAIAIGHIQAKKKNFLQIFIADKNYISLGLSELSPGPGTKKTKHT
jgi:hypothetical protein